MDFYMYILENLFMLIANFSTLVREKKLIFFFSKISENCVHVWVFNQQLTPLFTVYWLLKIYIFWKYLFYSSFFCVIFFEECLINFLYNNFQSLDTNQSPHAQISFHFFSFLTAKIYIYIYIYFTFQESFFFFCLVLTK